MVALEGMFAAMVTRRYEEDVRALIAKRRDNGGEFWASADGRWGTGSPFSTFDCALMLSELGMKRTDPVMKGAAEVLFDAWRDDGRFRPAPKAATYPCHTANAARVLCRLGFARDRRLKKTFEHLLETQHDDGGWRCNTVKLGKTAETDASNPGTTLAALDAFRFSPLSGADKRLDKAAKFLLEHWGTRRPLGPCGFGIGTLFMKIEFPFLRYNLFFYVYVLSFYRTVVRDKSFRDALRTLQSKVVDSRIVVENPNRNLAKFSFCAKGQPSRLATKRYRELLGNLKRASAVAR
jgi:hypothetical protein